MDTLSKSELAAAFGVSLPTVDAWVLRRMPYRQRGSRGQPWAFHLPDCIAWRIEDVIAHRIEKSEGQALDLNYERARLAKAQATKTEREIAIMDRKLIPAEQVESVWGGMVSAFRARILALPSRVAPQVAAESDPHTVDAMLTDVVHEALTELSEYDPEHYGD